MTELKLEPWGNHHYKGSKPKTKEEIDAFENGQAISCLEIPNACKEFPDACMCRHLCFQRRWDDKGVVLLFEPEISGNLGTKPWLLEEMKGFESSASREADATQLVTQKHTCENATVLD